MSTLKGDSGFRQSVASARTDKRWRVPARMAPCACGASDGLTNLPALGSAQAVASDRKRSVDPAMTLSALLWDPVSDLRRYNLAVHDRFVRDAAFEPGRFRGRQRCQAADLGQRDTCRA